MAEARLPGDVAAAIAALAPAQAASAPFYLYDLRTVRDRAARLKAAFPGAILLYAMKANSNPHVVRTVIEAGFGIETVSLGEVLLARALGARRVLFTNNNISDDEMAAVLALAAEGGGGGSGCEVWINCDSTSRLERMPAGQGVFLRANGPVGAGHHAKVTTCACANSRGEGGARAHGFTSHAGS
jgi:diaminopimelate decarboxylase